MSFRNQPSNEVSFSIRQLSGKSRRQSATAETTIECLYQIAYNLREDKYKDASFENYKRAVNLSCQGVKLKNLNSTLASTNIQQSGIIRETLKKWTNGYGVDLANLTVQDPITFDEITGKPYLLDPGCKHVLEESSLTKWIEYLFKKGQEPNCMCCRTKIDDKHIDKLVPVRPTPDEKPLWLIAIGLFNNRHQAQGNARMNFMAQVFFNQDFPHVEAPSEDNEAESRHSPSRR